MIALLPQVIVDVLLTGSIYAIVAIGLTMVFGVMRIVNFAHGDFLMIGLYVTYIFSAWLGIEPYIAVIAILPLVPLLASLSFRFLIRPIIGTPENNQIGRAHVRTPVTKAQIECSRLLEKKKNKIHNTM